MEKILYDVLEVSWHKEVLFRDLTRTKRKCRMYPVEILSAGLVFCFVFFVEAEYSKKLFYILCCLLYDAGVQLVQLFKKGMN